MKKILAWVMSFTVVISILSLPVTAFADVWGTAYLVYYAFGGYFPSGGQEYYTTQKHNHVVISGGAYEQITVGSGVPTPTKTGYDFAGWRGWVYFSHQTSYSDQNKMADGTMDQSYLTRNSTIPMSNGTLYTPSANIATSDDRRIIMIAGWKIHNYNVIFHYNQTTKTEHKTYQTDYIIPDTIIPQKDGYEFLGWNTYDGAAEAAYKAGDAYTTESDVNLYPVWEKCTYTVNYHGNGGEGAPDSQTTQIDDGKTITSTEPARDGYSFEGWAKSTDALEADYFSGDLLPNENLELFALWKPVLGEDGAAVSGQSEFEGESAFYEDIYVNFTNRPTYLCLDLTYPDFIHYDKVENLAVSDELQLYENKIGSRRVLNISAYNESGIELSGLTRIARVYFNTDDNDNHGTYSININPGSSFVMYGDQAGEISNITNQQVELLPYKAKKIEINGPASISEPTRFTVDFTPEKTAVKTVQWSVDDENIAFVSEDGLLTPVKNGTVTLTANSIDGSDLIAELKVGITGQPAVIKSLSASEGEFTEEYVPSKYEYTLIVPEDSESVVLTAEFNAGTLLCGNYGMMFSKIGKTVFLEEDEQELTLTKKEEGYDDTDYRITIIKNKVPPIVIGDVNYDNTVDVFDSLIIQKYAVDKAALDENQLYAADVNNDNYVDVLDAALIQSYAVGKVQEFPKKA